MTNAWERLGFEVKGNDPWEVNVPSFRSEVDRPIDLVEEFLRIHGTKELQDSSVSFPSSFRENDPTYDFCQKATDNLVGQGFQECCNYSLRSGEEILAWHADLDIEKLALANPLSSDHTHIRASLLPGLVDNLAHNQKNFNDIVRFLKPAESFDLVSGETWNVSVSHSSRLNNRTLANGNQKKNSIFLNSRIVFSEFYMPAD